MKISSHHRLRRRAAAGFTLIEMVLVLGIIALLAGAGIYMLTGVLDVGKERRVDADLKTLAVALQSYETSNGFMPSEAQGLAALTERPTTTPVPQRWRQFLEEELKDPWAQPYEYRYPAKKSKKPYDLFSKGPDMQEGTADDIGNWKIEPN
ncbi:MAG: type II secretion system major pseudopilin GspG [Verrucomicrobiales bacterium]